MGNVKEVVQEMFVKVIAAEVVWGDVKVVVQKTAVKVFVEEHVKERVKKCVQLVAKDYAQGDALNHVLNKNSL